MNQIFTAENKQKKYNFLPFSRGLHCMCFFQWNFSWSMGQYFGSAVTHTLQEI